MSTSSIKREIRRFHVVVVQWTSKKCTKKRDACAELLFWSLNLLFLWSRRCGRRRSCLSSLIKDKEVSRVQISFPGPKNTSKMSLTITSLDVPPRSTPRLSNTIMKLQRIVIKSFRFGNENEYEIKLKDFARVLKKKKKTPRKGSFDFPSPKQLVQLSILKEVKPSPDSKLIKLLTFDNLFTPLRHSR